MGWAWLRRSLAWLVGIGVPLVLLAVAWRQTDPKAGLLLVARAGPFGALALAPFGLMLALDALGWRLLLAPKARRRVAFSEAFASRLCGEAVGQSLPSAGLAGDAAAAWLVSKRTELPLGDALGSLAARHVLFGLGHGLVLAIAALVAATQRATPPFLTASLVATSAALLLFALFGPRLLVLSSPFSRLDRALRHAPWCWLRTWARGSSLRLRAADAETSRLLEGPWRPRLLAALCFTLVTLTETVETWLLLRLLGAPVGLLQVLSFEPLVSLLRVLAFFVPAGLGVQDLGYVALLRQVGVPQAAAVAAGFVALKRLKELLWTSVGWSVLLVAEAHTADGGRDTGNDTRQATHPLHLRVAQPDDADAPDRTRAAGA